ncbi:MAG: hypothetical protein ACI92I_000015 [Acidimicrobiales bacterium]|jgi:hypothetical protein
MWLTYTDGSLELIRKSRTSVPSIVEVTNSSNVIGVYIGELPDLYLFCHKKTPGSVW